MTNPRKRIDKSV